MKKCLMNMQCPGCNQKKNGKCPYANSKGRCEYSFIKPFQQKNKKIKARKSPQTPP